MSETVLFENRVSFVLDSRRQNTSKFSSTKASFRDPIRSRIHSVLQQLPCA